MARSNSDIYFKGILEDLFADFLRFFYPNADEMFDMNKGFDFLDQELEKLYPVGDAVYPKSVDKLVKVFTKDGKEEWILVHVEVQGYKDHEFAERMFTYFYRIRDSFGKRVRSIVIFTDSHKGFHPKQYVYEDDDTSVVFKYKTYKVIDQDPAELELSDNPFAWVILTVLVALQKNRLKGKGAAYLDLTLDLVKRLFRKGFAKDKINVLLDFIRMYVHFDKLDIIRKFDEQIDVLNNKMKTMGIREQILYIAKEEATIKNQRAFVKNLLQENIFTVEKIAQLANVSVDFVLKIQKQL